MPIATIDGISTRYEVLGSGPPLLMFSPGGFDAVIEKWRNQSVYAEVKFLDHLPERYSCIVFDRRECGQSGGRVERIGWRDYAAQGKGLLDHLGIPAAHIMGGCMGVSVAAAFATLHPQATQSLVLMWPVGGPRYRISSQQRFATHLAFVNERGLAEVAATARQSGKSFGEDPRGGPWAATIRSDPDFAEAYAAQDVDRYKLIIAGMARMLIDRDTAPGAEPEDLLRLDIPALIIPGRDAAHAPSAARYWEECLPRSEYWDVPVAEQVEETVPARVLDFLERAGGPG
jgi:pimeloyl-ACP methyl ester carboxylesterase